MFEELNKKSGNKRCFCLIIRQTNTVLKKRILRDLLHQLPVRKSKLLLDQLGTKYCPKRFCRHPCFIRKQLCIPFFNGISCNGFGFLTQRLVEICKFKLMIPFEFIHKFSPKCKVFVLFFLFFLHSIILYLIRKPSKFNAFKLNFCY